MGELYGGMVGMGMMDGGRWWVGCGGRSMVEFLSIG
jgi:hypothetical protein